MTTNAEIFKVGILSSFRTVQSSQIVDRLAALPQFAEVSGTFILALKGKFSVFLHRLNRAVEAKSEEIWAALTDEPKKSLKHTLKDCSTQGKSLCQSFYYAVYIVLFWCHRGCAERYSQSILTLEAFQQQCSSDADFTLKNFSLAKTADNWDQLFSYRNVLMLGLLIQPATRQKGSLTRVASILGEGRIHSTGGGQSYSATRRGRIYDVAQVAVSSGLPLTTHGCFSSTFQPVSGALTAGDATPSQTFDASEVGFVLANNSGSSLSQPTNTFSSAPAEDDSEFNDLLTCFFDEGDAFPVPGPLIDFVPFTRAVPPPAASDASVTIDQGCEGPAVKKLKMDASAEVAFSSDPTQSFESASVSGSSDGASSCTTDADDFTWGDIDFLEDLLV